MDSFNNDYRRIFGSYFDSQKLNVLILRYLSAVELMIASVKLILRNLSNGGRILNPASIF